jgi:hypothetical protein
MSLLRKKLISPLLPNDAGFYEDQFLSIRLTIYILNKMSINFSKYEATKTFATGVFIYEVLLSQYLSTLSELQEENIRLAL